MLYPAELRNLLMHLALTGLFRAKWSADIHEEWISALLEKRPDLTRDKLERTRALMDLCAVDALATGYEDLIPGLHLPDPNDRHVLAAAIRGQADVIVTMNLRDFPTQVVSHFGIEAQHPDDFVIHLLDLAPGAVLAAAAEHRRSLRNPPRSAAEYLAALERQQLTQTASALAEFLRQIRKERELVSESLFALAFVRRSSTRCQDRRCVTVLIWRPFPGAPRSGSGAAHRRLSA